MLTIFKWCVTYSSMSLGLKLRLCSPIDYISSPVTHRVWKWVNRSSVLIAGLMAGAAYQFPHLAYFIIIFNTALSAGLISRITFSFISLIYWYCFSMANTRMPHNTSFFLLAAGPPNDFRWLIDDYYYFLLHAHLKYFCIINVFAGGKCILCRFQMTIW